MTIRPASGHASVPATQPPSLHLAALSPPPRARTTTQTANKMTTMTRLSYPALEGPPLLRAQAQHGGALPVSWEARRAVRVLAWMMSSFLDSAVGELGAVAVVVRFPDSEVGEVSLALGADRMAHQCCRVRVWMARVRVAGSKVMIGPIGEVGQMVEVGAVLAVADTKAVGAREDLEVAGVARGGMDPVESVGVVVTELSPFYNLLSVSHSFFPWNTLL